MKAAIISFPASDHDTSLGFRQRLIGPMAVRDPFGNLVDTNQKDAA